MLGEDKKDTFDALMKQAEFFSQRHYNRQSYQWKISFGLWAALGFAVKATVESNHQVLPWFWVVGGIVVIILQGWWLGSVHARNGEDLHRALDFRDQASDCLIATDYRPVRVPRDER